MAGAGCRGGWRGGGTTHRRAPLLRSRPPACPRPPPGAVGAGVPARDLAGRTCAGRRGAALRRHLAADTRHRAWLHPLKGCQGLPEAGVAPPPPLRARGGRAAAGGCLSLLEPPPPPPGDGCGRVVPQVPAGLKKLGGCWRGGPCCRDAEVKIRLGCARPCPGRVWARVGRKGKQK